MNLNSKKLTIPDLISVGVFTAIYFVLVTIATFSCALLPGVGNILLPAVAALISGSVYMLLAAKLQKFGGISIMGLVMGLFFFMSGHFVLSFAANIVCGVLADWVASRRQYRSKKVLLANVLYELISAYKSAANVSVLFVWLYAAAYVLHLYFDFSGYSDMAIGLGRIFGFHFIENFNYPYISASVTEFWRRWHMSLGSWFRDYVYIPLGGNRVSKAKWFRNIFIVWLLTGLWHGAAWTFILWGLFFAVFLTAEKLWYGEALAQTRFLKHLYVLLLIAVSFVIFDAASVSDAFRTIGSLFGLGGLPRSDALARYYFDSYSGVFLVAIVGATPLPAKIVRQFSEDGPGKKIMSVVEPVVLLALLAVVTAYLVDGSFNPFLYFRF